MHEFYLQIEWFGTVILIKSFKYKSLLFLDRDIKEIYIFGYMLFKFSKLLEHVYLSLLLLCHLELKPPTMG